MTHIINMVWPHRFLGLGNIVLMYTESSCTDLSINLWHIQINSSNSQTAAPYMKPHLLNNPYIYHHIYHTYIIIYTMEYTYIIIYTIHIPRGGFQ